MASKDEAEQALFDAITAAAKVQTYGDELRALAEALAWLVDPRQPHGGSVRVCQ